MAPRVHCSEATTCCRTMQGRDCGVDGITKFDRMHAFMAWGCLWKMRDATRHSLWPNTSMVLVNVCKLERSNSRFHGLRPWGGWHVAQATRWSPCWPFEFQQEQAIGESVPTRHILLHRFPTSLVCFESYHWRASMRSVGCFQSKTRCALCVGVGWGASEDPLCRHLSFSPDPASSTWRLRTRTPSTSPSRVASTTVDARAPSLSSPSDPLSHNGIGIRFSRRRFDLVVEVGLLRRGRGVAAASRTVSHVCGRPSARGRRLFRTWQATAAAMADHHDTTFESADSGASLTIPQQAGQVRKNGFIVIKGRPCKVRAWSWESDDRDQG